MWEPKDSTVLRVIGILLLATLLTYIGEIFEDLKNVIGGVVGIVILSWPVLVWILFVLGSLVLLWIAVRVVRSAWRN